MQVQYLQLLHETTITQNVTQVSYKGTPFMETPKRDNSRINNCNKNFKHGMWDKTFWVKRQGTNRAKHLTITACYVSIGTTKHV